MKLATVIAAALVALTTLAAAPANAGCPPYHHRDPVPIGRWETRTEQRWVEGQYTQRWIDGRCYTRGEFDRRDHDRRHRRHARDRYETRGVTYCEPGRYTQVWVPGHFEHFEREVWVPAYRASW